MARDRRAARGVAARGRRPIRAADAPPPEPAVGASRFLEPRVGPDREGHRPRQRPGPQARQPVPADRPVRRHPPGLARPRPLPQRHAAAVVLRAPRRRRAAGPPPGLDGRELPGRRSSSRTRRSTATRTTRSSPGQGLAGQDARDHPRAADQRRRAGGADPDRQLRRGRRDGRGRRSSWPTTRPTSSRSAAIPATAARCCRSPPTTTRATFRYDGLDGHRRRTHVAFSEPGYAPGRRRPDDGRDLGGAVRYRGSWPLGAGASHELSWLVWSSDGPSPSGERGTAGEDGHQADGDAATTLFPEAPRIAPDEGAGGVPRLERGARPRSRPTTSCST